MSSNRRSGMGGSQITKPKDFKKSVKRIFIELGIFEYFILLAVKNIVVKMGKRLQKEYAQLSISAKAT